MTAKQENVFLLDMNIFQSQPTLTNQDRQDLAPYLSGWNKVIASFGAGMNRENTKKLILLELERDNPRFAIISKMVIYLQKLERKELFERMKCQNQNLSEF